MVRKNTLTMVIGLIIATVVVVTMATPAVANGAQVTSGEFNTYAAGPERGFDISGHAVMIRTASGKTIVNTYVTGLAPNTSYGSHVHNLPCDVNNGGGHYQHLVGGPVNNVNEIWPGFSTNPAGIGNGKAKNDFTARPEAQSIVMHDSDGARIACADLS